MRKKRCFSYKKKGNIVYDYLKKRKIIAISKNINKDNNN